jgi:hypothetical protein
MEVGFLNNAPWWRKWRSRWRFGRDGKVFGYKCRNCGFIEFYFEKWESVRSSELGLCLDNRYHTIRQSTLDVRAYDKTRWRFEDGWLILEAF